MKTEKRIYGLLFGVLAGVAFSLAMWGYDAYLLSQASVDMPWIKLLLGVLPCMLIGGLAGWLSARFDNRLLSFVFWTLAGLSFAWLGNHIPYEGLTVVTGWLQPELHNLEPYPIIENMRFPMSQLYLVVSVLVGIAGAFELFVIESAQRAPFAIGRWATMIFLSFLIFAPAGILVDDLVNENMRQSYLAVVQETPPATPAPTDEVSLQSETPPAQKLQELLSTPIPSQPAELSSAPNYAITLDIDYSAHRFTGAARVKYINAESDPMEHLFFRLLPNGGGSFGNGYLTVTSVLVDDQAASTQLSGQDTILEVSLPNTLEPGESTTVVFEFEGVVPVNFNTGYGIYNFTNDVMALSSWYPILSVYDDQGWNLDPPSNIGDSVYSDIAFYTVEVTTPQDIVVASTGALIDQGQDGNKKRQRFESGPVRDFFLIMSPDFQVDSQLVGGTTVNAYYLPGHESANDQALSIAAGSIRIFNEKFGSYPYTEFDLVDAPMQYALGVEFPGIVLVSSALYDTPDDPSFTVATAHEVAHQWWYNVVGNDVFDEPWLDEALTTYTSSLYYEYGVSLAAAIGLQTYWQNRYADLVDQGGDDAITQSLAHFESMNNSRVYSGVVYNKGALFFKALREEIGDQAFFDALQNYYQNYQYKIASGEDLLNSFEEAAGRPLDDFYKEWLY